jgi:hypothetical protein
LRPISGYQVTRATDFGEELPPIEPPRVPLSQGPIAERSLEKEAKFHADDYEEVPLKPGRTETQALTAKADERAERDLVRLPDTASPLSQKLSKPEESEREPPSKTESPATVLAPADSPLRQMKSMSAAGSRRRLEPEPAAKPPVAERAAGETRRSKPISRDAAKRDAGGTQADRKPPDRTQARQNEPAQNKRSIQPQLQTADQPAPVSRTPVQKLTPEQHSFENRTVGYSPSYKQADEAKASRKAVHIGTIDIHVAPAPAAPEVRRVIRQAPGFSAPMLARGYTSQFGLRQG